MKRAMTILAAAAVLLPSFSGCAARYDAAECNTPLIVSSDSDNYFYRPKGRSLDFNRVIEENGLTFYYENGLEARKIDRGVDAVKCVGAFCEVPQTVYLLEDTVTHVNRDGLWVDPDDSAELIGAVLLESAAQAELPFGIFAGVSANLLGKERAFKIYNEKRLKDSLEEYPYVKELQYPLYTARGTAKAERETAWNFAYRLGETYLAQHTVQDLSGATQQDILPALEAVGAVLPEYYFPVGDCEYPTQVIAEHIHYFFAYNYEDCEFHDDLLEYRVLTAFVSENEALIDAVSPIFGCTLPKRIDAFFGKQGEFNLATTGYSDIRQNAIACYTAGIFGHEIVHHISYWGGGDGYFNEVICSYFAIKYSGYARRREYLDYSLQTENRVGADYSEENIEFLKAARALYQKTFGECSVSDFDAEAWLQCGTYLYNQKRPEITVVAQGITMVQYIYETYGWDVLMEINRSYRSAQIGGKTYSDFQTEWAEWIESLFRKDA